MSKPHMWRLCFFEYLLSIILFLLRRYQDEVVRRVADPEREVAELELFALEVNLAGDQLVREYRVGSERRAHHGVGLVSAPRGRLGDVPLGPAARFEVRRRGRRGSRISPGRRPAGPGRDDGTALGRGLRGRRRRGAERLERPRPAPAVLDLLRDLLGRDRGEGFGRVLLLGVLPQGQGARLGRDQDAVLRAVEDSDVGDQITVPIEDVGHDAEAAVFDDSVVHAFYDDQVAIRIVLVPGDHQRLLFWRGL